MRILDEFKQFAIKGNVMDLAIGVIIGAAFGKIIDSVIKDLILPLVAGILKKPDFSHLFFAFKNTPEGSTLEEAQDIGPVIAYGNFITVIIDFLLLAIVVFMIVKVMNQLKKKEAAAPAPPPAISSTDALLIEIRDALKK